MSEQKYLGKRIDTAVDELDTIPWTGGELVVTLDCTEFRSFCPVSGQPDFGRLEICYVPDKYLVETKSVKLFLRGYHEKKAFNESIVNEIADRFQEQIKPQELTVKGNFNMRGGIAVEAMAHRGKVNEQEQE